MGAQECIKYLVFIFNFLFWVCRLLHTVFAVSWTGWFQSSVRVSEQTGKSFKSQLCLIDAFCFNLFTLIGLKQD